MRLKALELSGFKSFGRKTAFLFPASITAIVGPNGSGKSNVAEAVRWTLGERSLKSLRGQRREDLIFSGGGGSARTGRAAVTLILDNRDRKLPLDYDEAAITREVYRDGTNVYLVNGSPVRLKDLWELLSPAALGFSGHFIIHQGEADQVINASPQERRAVIEDALGLRFYQWKIEDSERKLERTGENMEKAAALRREIAPHLLFLKKQVERIEQADRLRRELRNLYLDYFQREEVYLTRVKRAVTEEKAEPLRELAEIKKKLEGAESSFRQEEIVRHTEKRLAGVEQELSELTLRINESQRRLGRLEGLLQSSVPAGAGERRRVAWEEFAEIVRTVQKEIAAVLGLDEIAAARKALTKIKTFLDQTFSRLEQATLRGTSAVKAEQSSADKSAVERTLAELEREVQNVQRQRAELGNILAKARETAAKAERETMTFRSRETELRSLLQAAAAREEKWQVERANFERELNEAKLLAGEEVLQYREAIPSVPPEGEDRAGQEERRRRLERLKIRLEDLGVQTDATLDEYREAEERDRFLAKELADLQASAAALRQLIGDLRNKIDQEFKRGLEQINRYLQEFFALMFGGGSARLILIRGERVESPAEEAEEKAMAPGVEIRVSLPRKRIQSLSMLSGGERALLAAAFLFARSQVKPPPFLILDETDAALDESNSRKYGELIKKLARTSQLILITHNRETMACAGVLYGVTMGRDGVSKVLSVKLEEAKDLLTPNL